MALGETTRTELNPSRTGDFYPAVFNEFAGHKVEAPIVGTDSDMPYKNEQNERQINRFKSNPAFTSQVIFGDAHEREVEYQKYGLFGKKKEGQTYTKLQVKPLSIAERLEQIKASLPGTNWDIDQDRQNIADEFFSKILTEFNIRKDYINARLIDDDGNLRESAVELIVDSVTNYFVDSINFAGENYGEVVAKLQGFLNDLDSKLNSTDNSTPKELVAVFKEARLVVDLMMSNSVRLSKRSIDDVAKITYKQRLGCIKIPAVDVDTFIQNAKENYLDRQDKFLVPTAKAGKSRITSPDGTELSIEELYKHANATMDPSLSASLRTGIENYNKTHGTEFTLQDYSGLAYKILQSHFESENNAVRDGTLDPKDVSMQELTIAELAPELKELYLNGAHLDGIEFENNEMILKSLAAIRLIVVIGGVAIGAYGALDSLNSNEPIQGFSYEDDETRENHFMATSGYGQIDETDRPNANPTDALQQFAREFTHKISPDDADNIHLAHSEISPMVARDTGEHHPALSKSEELQTQSIGDKESMVENDSMDNHQHSNLDDIDDDNANDTGVGDLDVSGENISEERVEDHRVMVSPEQLDNFHANDEKIYKIQPGETISHALVAKGLSQSDIYGEDGKSGIWQDMKSDSFAVFEKDGKSYITLVVYDDPSNDNDFVAMKTPGTDVIRDGSNVIFIEVDKDSINEDLITELQTSFNSGRITEDEIRGAITNIEFKLNNPPNTPVALDNKISDITKAPGAADLYKTWIGDENYEGQVPDDYFKTIDDREGRVIVLHNDVDGTGFFIIAEDSDGNDTYDKVSAIRFDKPEDADEIQNNLLGEALVIDSTEQVQENDDVISPKIVILEVPDNASESDLADINESVNQSLISNGYAIRQAKLTEDGVTSAQVTVVVNVDKEGIVTGRLDGAPQFFVIDENEIPQTHNELLQLIDEKFKDGTLVKENQISSEDGKSATIIDENTIDEQTEAVPSEGEIITEESDETIPEDEELTVDDDEETIEQSTPEETSLPPTPAVTTTATQTRAETEPAATVGTTPTQAATAQEGTTTPTATTNATPTPTKTEPAPTVSSTKTAAATQQPTEIPPTTTTVPTVISSVTEQFVYSTENTWGENPPLQSELFQTALDGGIITQDEIHELRMTEKQMELINNQLIDTNHIGLAAFPVDLENGAEGPDKIEVIAAVIEIDGKYRRMQESDLIDGKVPDDINYMRVQSLNIDQGRPGFRLEVEVADAYIETYNKTLQVEPALSHDNGLEQSGNEVKDDLVRRAAIGGAVVAAGMLAVAGGFVGLKLRQRGLNREAYRTMSGITKAQLTEIENTIKESDIETRIEYALGKPIKLSGNHEFYDTSLYAGIWKAARQPVLSNRDDSIIELDEKQIGILFSRGLLVGGASSTHDSSIQFSIDNRTQYGYWPNTNQPYLSQLEDEINNNFSGKVLLGCLLSPEFPESIVDAIQKQKGIGKVTDLNQLRKIIAQTIIKEVTNKRDENGNDLYAFETREIPDFEGLGVYEIVLVENTQSEQINSTEPNDYDLTNINSVIDRLNLTPLNENDITQIRDKIGNGELTLNDLAGGYRNLIDLNRDNEGRFNFETLDNIRRIETYVANVKALGLIDVRFDTDSTDFEMRPDLTISSTEHTAPSLERTINTNQDAIWSFSDPSGNFEMRAVLDGVGGQDSASAKFAVGILDDLSTDNEFKIETKSLEEIVRVLNEKLNNIEEIERQGTTITLMRQIGNQVEFANVGDSIAVIYDFFENTVNISVVTRGHTLARQNDETLIGEERDLAFLDGDEEKLQQLFDGANAKGTIRERYERTITRALNSKGGELEIDYTKKEIQSDQSIVIFSDGLTGNLSLSEIALALHSGFTAKDLVEIANAKSSLDIYSEESIQHRLKQDDISAIVIRVDKKDSGATLQETTSSQELGDQPILINIELAETSEETFENVRQARGESNNKTFTVEDFVQKLPSLVIFQLRSFDEIEKYTKLLLESDNNGGNDEAIELANKIREESIRREFIMTGEDGFERHFDVLETPEEVIIDFLEYAKLLIAAPGGIDDEQKNKIKTTLENERDKIDKSREVLIEKFDELLANISLFEEVSDSGTEPETPDSELQEIVIDNPELQKKLKYLKELGRQQEMIDMLEESGVNLTDSEKRAIRVGRLSYTSVFGKFIILEENVIKSNIKILPEDKQAISTSLSEDEVIFRIVRNRPPFNSSNQNLEELKDNGEINLKDNNIVIQLINCGHIEVASLPFDINEIITGEQDDDYQEILVKKIVDGGYEFEIVDEDVEGIKDWKIIIKDVKSETIEKEPDGTVEITQQLNKKIEVSKNPEQLKKAKLLYFMRRLSDLSELIEDDSVSDEMKNDITTGRISLYYKPIKGSEEEVWSLGGEDLNEIINKDEYRNDINEIYGSDVGDEQILFDLSRGRIRYSVVSDNSDGEFKFQDLRTEKIESIYAVSDDFHVLLETGHVSIEEDALIDFLPLVEQEDFSVNEIAIQIRQGIEEGKYELITEDEEIAGIKSWVVRVSLTNEEQSEKTETTLPDWVKQLDDEWPDSINAHESAEPENTINVLLESETRKLRDVFKNIYPPMSKTDILQLRVGRVPERIIKNLYPDFDTDKHTVSVHGLQSVSLDTTQYTTAISFSVYELPETMNLEVEISGESKRREIARNELRVMVERGLLKRSNEGWTLESPKDIDVVSILTDNKIVLLPSLLSPDIPESFASKYLVGQTYYDEARIVSKRILGQVITVCKGDNPKYKLEVREIAGLEELGYKELVLVENIDYKEPEVVDKSELSQEDLISLALGKTIPLNEDSLRDLQNTNTEAYSNLLKYRDESYDDITVEYQKNEKTRQSIADGKLVVGVIYDKESNSYLLSAFASAFSMRDMQIKVDGKTIVTGDKDKIEKLISSRAVTRKISNEFEFDEERNDRVSQLVASYNENKSVDVLAELIYNNGAFTHEGSLPQELIEEITKLDNENRNPIEHASKVVELINNYITENNLELEVLEEGVPEVGGSKVHMVRIVKSEDIENNNNSQDMKTDDTEGTNNIYTTNFVKVKNDVIDTDFNTEELRLYLERNEIPLPSDKIIELVRNAINKETQIDRIGFRSELNLIINDMINNEDSDEDPVKMNLVIAISNAAKSISLQLTESAYKQLLNKITIKLKARLSKLDLPKKITETTAKYYILEIMNASIK